MDSYSIKEISKKMGVEVCGITDAYFDEVLFSRLESREKYGGFTEFENCNLEKRSNPQTLLQGADSIIVFAFPYKYDVLDEIPEDDFIEVSSYCRGEDYHRVIDRFLERFIEIIEYRLEKENYEGKFEYVKFCDTTDMVDRHLAYKAGIGYFGYNNCLINDVYGSYFFIGGIITNLKLEKDSPSDKKCLGCMKCIKSCPGQALSSNYRMNPNKCASYITQKKKELSEEETEVLKKSKKIFGCDVCQEVCPHNANIRDTFIEEFKTNLVTGIRKSELDELSQKKFRKAYGDRAFSWRGATPLKRNAGIIADDSHDEDLI